jgi:UDP-glucose 4-epimerase
MQQGQQSYRLTAAPDGLYLITGGAGFIGSHIVEHLLKQGRRVRVLDNFSTGSRENLPEAHPLLEIINANICHPRDVTQVMRGVDHLLHLAALPSVQRSLEDPERTHLVNATGTVILLECARQAKVKSFIYASSSSVYGEPRTGWGQPAKSENTPRSEADPTFPISPYGASKLAGEAYSLAYARSYRMRVLCLRLFNVFGPRQDPGSPYAAVIPRFITTCLKGSAPIIFGDGQQSRDFTYVLNVVDGFFRAVACGLSGVVLNLACGRSTTVNELARMVIQLTGKRLTPVHTPPRPGDIRHSRADITLAGRLLAYRPHFELEQGLRDTVKWYQEKRTAQRRTRAGS